jgi:predicted DNA binding CopG/RHH family protein
MKEIELDAEERQLLEEYERGEWVSVLTPERREELRKIAENTLRIRQQIIDVKLSSEDVDLLDNRAREVGLPREFLASNILHQYLSGRLVAAPDK